MTPLDGAWESLFWGVFQRSSNPIAVLDDRERIVAINDAAVDLSGRARSELLGSPMPRWFSPQTRAAAREGWERVLRVGESIGRRRLVRADGTEVDVDYASRVIRLVGRSLVLAVVLPASLPSFWRRTRPSENTQLTRREREVVGLIADGMETPAIAATLHVSQHTVRAHVRNSLKKLDARTRAHLVALVLCDPSVAYAETPGEQRDAGAEHD